MSEVQIPGTHSVTVAVETTDAGRRWYRVYGGGTLLVSEPTRPHALQALRELIEELQAARVNLHTIGAGREESSKGGPEGPPALKVVS